jgi:hypothetical protein
MQALKYLHTSLASIVDHKNPKEEREVLYFLGCTKLGTMALRVVELSSRGYKIRKIFA